MKRVFCVARVFVLIALALSVSGCEQPQVYGSVGYSSWGGGGLGGSISIGGRIF